MTVLLAPIDAIAESQRLIDILEQRRGELPFAEELLSRHLPAHQQLARCQASSEAAVNAWRAALAQRWECEVRGRRLYKQIYRQHVEHYGSREAPEVRLISRAGAEADSSPSELLADLRRLGTALALNVDQLPFAPARLAELNTTCAALEQAIAAASALEAERRESVLDRRMAQEAYRRLSAATRDALFDFYGERGGELDALFDSFLPTAARDS